MQRLLIFSQPIRWSIYVLLGLMSTSGLVAQQWLSADGEVHRIESKEQIYQDFLIPTLNETGRMSIEIEGADGGWIEYNYTDRFDNKRTKRIHGGEGATVNAVYSIGTAESQLPGGSVLRFMIGNRGCLAKYELLTKGGYGAGGGGGTAVLFSKNGGNTWNLLLVAGAGGGAAIDIEGLDTKYNPGLPGLSGDQKILKNNIRTQTSPGGKRGQGGMFSETTGGGGGAFSNGAYEDHALYYGNAGWVEFERMTEPLGGLGGSQEGCRDGGWGFGGGGSGCEGGGGGGGYSGGGAGKPGYGGEGGSSYVNIYSIQPVAYSTRQNSDTNNSSDGWAQYRIQ